MYWTDRREQWCRARSLRAEHSFFRKEPKRRLRIDRSFTGLVHVDFEKVERQSLIIQGRILDDEIATNDFARP